MIDQKDNQTPAINWLKIIRNNLIILVIPILVIIIPLFSGQAIELENVLTAIVVFGILAYLKLLYQGKAR